MLMLASSFRTALRSLTRNRGFAFLNVAGLGLGLACVILIALYAHDELIVDDFHENRDRIARVDLTWTEDGEVDELPVTPAVMGPEITARVPSAQAVVRVTTTDAVLTVGEQAFEAERGALMADDGFFDVFSFPLIEGDAATVLAEPGRVVVSQSLARTLFGDAPAVGQTLTQAGYALTVSGVMADVPRHSHLNFSAVTSLATMYDVEWLFSGWFSNAVATYTLMREGTSADAFEAQLGLFIEEAAGTQMAEMAIQLVPVVRPLEGLYFSDAAGIGRWGSQTTLRILTLIALFVLVVAGVNFTNLATARSLDRAREVGVRRTLGAGRVGLAIQFLIEAVLLSLVALVIAVGLAWIALPTFRIVADLPVVLADLGMWWSAIVALAIGTGLLAGAYPAFVLSGFRPAQVLKGQFATGKQGAMLRHGLVGLQFTASIALLAATAIVFGQLDFMQNRDLGFDAGDEQSQLVLLPYAINEEVAPRLAELRERIGALPQVQGLSIGLSAPTSGGGRGSGFVQRADGSEQEMLAGMFLADTSLAPVMGLTLTAGRNMRPMQTRESPREALVNETATRQAGYAEPSDALGKQAEFWGMNATIVGVVRDFHTQGLQAEISPAFISPVPPGNTDFLNNILIRVGTTDLSETLDEMQAIWTDLAPTRPFEYAFMDERFAEQYQTEQRFGTLFLFFAGLAIAIALLGLFGLAAHSASKRAKEIGVRRVLGATVVQVIALLGRGTVALVLISVLLAVPAVVWGMNTWLDGFAYRIDVGVAPFALAGGTVLILALATVAYHAVRAARLNPAASLRDE